MKAGPYSNIELNTFATVLDAAIDEAEANDIDLRIEFMAQRLFDAASRGERNPDKLREAIFQGIEKRRSCVASRTA